MCWLAVHTSTVVLRIFEEIMFSLKCRSWICVCLNHQFPVVVVLVVVVVVVVVDIPCVLFKQPRSNRHRWLPHVSVAGHHNLLLDFNHPNYTHI